MAAKFLCCLPLRLGVLLFTLFQFLVCGAAGGFLWFAYSVLRNHSEAREQELWENLPGDYKIILIVAASIYSFAALIGLLGFLGAIFKKTGFVRTYFALLVTVFLLEIGASIWYAVTFFKIRRQPEEDCLRGADTLGRLEFCSELEKLKDMHPGILVASILVPIIIMAYVMYVVHHYIKRLEKQKRDKVFGPGAKSVYAPVQGKEETYPLTQPAVTYPYTDASNSFGANGPAPAPTAYAPVAPLKV